MHFHENLHSAAQTAARISHEFYGAYFAGKMGWVSFYVNFGVKQMRSDAQKTDLSR